MSDSLVPQLQLFVEGCELPSICGNQALIFCKSSHHSKQQSCLSSPILFFVLKNSLKGVYLNQI